MIRVIVGSDPKALRDAYRLRHEVFVKEAGWFPESRHLDIETDQFDHEEAVHFLLTDDITGNLIGYQRLLPTTRPYLLTDAYPHLCDGEPPSGSDMFEWTRFAVKREYRGEGRSLGRAGAELVHAFVKWGLANDVRAVVVELEVVQTLKFAQCHFMPYPLGIAHPIDGREVMALVAYFDRRTLARLESMRAAEPIRAKA